VAQLTGVGASSQHPPHNSCSKTCCPASALSSPRKYHGAQLLANSKGHAQCLCEWTRDLLGVLLASFTLPFSASPLCLPWT
jgi:hypothetical protein